MQRIQPVADEVDGEFSARILSDKTDPFPGITWESAVNGERDSNCERPWRIRGSREGYLSGTMVRSGIANRA